LPIPDDLDPETASCVLLVDGDASIRQLVSVYLGEAGYKVITAENGIKALVKLRAILPRVIISELKMPRMSGCEFIGIMRRRFPTIPVIVFTASAPIGFPVEAQPDFVLEKNVHRLPDLVQVVNDLARSTPLPTELSAVATPARAVPGCDGYLMLSCPECLRTFKVTITPENEATEGTAVCTHCEARVPFFD
jgi:CheY-like chemotaxis protein